MKKKILSMVLCATTLFSAVGFSACEVLNFNKDLDEKIAGLEEQIAQLQQTIKGQQEDISDFETEVSNLQETINEQQEEIDNFEADSSMTQATISEHLEQILALQQENAILQTTITEMQALIATLEKENGNAKETISELQQNVIGLQQGNKSALMTIADLQQQIVELIQKQESWGTEITDDFFGAYFITDECYETYVRRRAASVGADDKWVSDALKDGQGGVWFYGTHPNEYYTLAYSKKTFYCVFANNQINVSSESDWVYNISKNGNIYQGIYQGASNTVIISFWLDGDTLYLIDRYNQMWVFEKDPTYVFDNEPVVLDTPENIEYSIYTYIGDKQLYVSLQWEYKDAYGGMGAAADVKTANAQEYKTVESRVTHFISIVHFSFKVSEFEIGENFIRVYNMGGGPSINRTKNSIYIEKNSDYKTFRVTIENGSVRVMPI